MGEIFGGKSINFEYLSHDKDDANRWKHHAPKAQGVQKCLLCAGTSKEKGCILCGIQYIE